MPVWIYGRVGSEPFTENSETINVCAMGGLIPIATRVRRFQKLVLTNLQTEEEVACRVVRVARTKRGLRLAGLEFLQAGARFWRRSALATGSISPLA
jgi:hypothetical protein